MPLGIGLKPQHFLSIIETTPALEFFEIHAENYMVEGGPFHYYLSAIRAQYALSIHGTALSLGGKDDLDQDHLTRLVDLVDRYEPLIVSEHLAWSTHANSYLSDLLPLVYSKASLHTVCQHIDQVQTALHRPLLLENPATYIEFAKAEFTEPEFISEIIKRTGCKLLLDISNVYVTCCNHQTDIKKYLGALPLSSVAQIHLAGFEAHVNPDDLVLIDSHSAAICDPVWELFESVLTDLPKKNTLPILIERDSNIPALSELMSEVRHAQAIELQAGAQHFLAAI